MATYTVRSVLEWTSRSGKEEDHAYEERLTIWNTDSLDEAIELAEKEETEYINDSTSEKEGMISLGFYQGFWCFNNIELKEQGVEIFSLLRESDLAPNEYLNAFFETGTEHQQE